jgi:3-methyladenine DNA glycosylase/8-oxoguanine DNA glycosylase
MAELTGERPSPAGLLARAEAWRPWRAYAAMHLWASLTASVASISQTGNRDQQAA